MTSLFVWVGVAIAAVASGLAGWALLWDRARGRRRCPRCWYDMSGAPETDGPVRCTCPECGRTVRRRRQLLRTRRRWRWAMLAGALGVAAYTVAVVPRVQTAGWRGAWPTTALILWVPATEPEPVWDRTSGRMSVSKEADELARRARAGDLWDWQWRWLLARCGVPEHRRRWPRDHPIFVSLRLPLWLESHIGPLGASSKAGLVTTWPPWERGYVGVISPEDDALEVEIKVRQSWRGVWHLPVTRVESIDDAITPVRSDSVDAAVQCALRIAIDAHSPRHTPLLSLQLRRDHEPSLADIAVGVVVELRRDGELTSSWPLLPLKRFREIELATARIHRPLLPCEETDEQEWGRWTVHVRGDGGTALGDLRRSRYWAGAYTLPLKDVMPDRARAP